MDKRIVLRDQRKDVSSALPSSGLSRDEIDKLRVDFHLTLLNGVKDDRYSICADEFGHCIARGVRFGDLLRSWRSRGLLTRIEDAEYSRTVGGGDSMIQNSIDIDSSYSSVEKTTSYRYTPIYDAPAHHTYVPLRSKFASNLPIQQPCAWCAIHEETTINWDLLKNHSVITHVLSVAIREFVKTHAWHKAYVSEIPSDIIQSIPAYAKREFDYETDIHPSWTRQVLELPLVLPQWFSFKNPQHNILSVIHGEKPSFNMVFTPAHNWICTSKFSDLILVPQSSPTVVIEKVPIVSTQTILPLTRSAAIVPQVPDVIRDPPNFDTIKLTLTVPESIASSTELVLARRTYAKRPAQATLKPGVSKRTKSSMIPPVTLPKTLVVTDVVTDVSENSTSSSSIVLVQPQTVEETRRSSRVCISKSNLKIKSITMSKRKNP